MPPRPAPRRRSTQRARGGDRPAWTADARRLAFAALQRIEVDGAYANLVLPAMLRRSTLDRRDRAFATELVYGTTRMRRACDWLVDRFLFRDVDPPVRTALRLGAYQLHVLRIAPHAAVSATVDLAPAKARSLVNAVLRRVAGAPVAWPDDATRLSYPDPLVERLTSDLGSADALAALDAMNQPPQVTERPDGYVQDPASRWVVDLVGAGAGDRVADVCAAPGGKATGLAGAGAWVAASDVSTVRAGLVAGNVERLHQSGQVSLVVADAASLPYRAASFDRVLVDAPCSGLGVLRRRPDARWRFDPRSIDRLAGLQRRLATSAAALVRPGGVLVFSVCTLTGAETLGVDAYTATALAGWEPLERPRPPWQEHGRGAVVLPQAAGTDGMYLLRLRRPGQ